MLSSSSAWHCSIVTRRGPALMEAGTAVLPESRSVPIGLDNLRRGQRVIEGLEARIALAVDVMLPPARLIDALRTSASAGLVPPSSVSNGLRLAAWSCFLWRRRATLWRRVTLMHREQRGISCSSAHRSLYLDRGSRRSRGRNAHDRDDRDYSTGRVDSVPSACSTMAATRGSASASLAAQGGAAFIGGDGVFQFLLAAFEGADDLLKLGKRVLEGEGADVGGLAGHAVS
jgi:hypothetical protein